MRALRNDPNVMKLLKSVQQNFLRATIKGLALGTVKTEKRMELNLLKLLNDFVVTSRESNDPIDIANKLKVIEKTMRRDKQSLEILSNAMDLAKRAKNIRDYRQTMKDLTKNSTKIDQICTKFRIDKTNYDVEKMINELHGRIKQHLQMMREKVQHSNDDLHVNSNLPKIQQQQQQQKRKEKLSHVIGSTPTNLISFDDIRLNETPKQPQLYVRMPINSNYYYWPLHQPQTSIPLESFYRYRRQQNNNNEDETMKAKQTEDEEGEFDDEFTSSNGNGGDGGLLGIIAGLSSPEGADVGALAGLISTVVTNLLGPDGLDIPSLLSTGTSLIAGLLSGDENFGAVIASYIGIAIEGISGGGGAASF